MPRRIYIHRSGASDACALTVARSNAHLPRSSCAGNWRLWMQIGPLQAQRGKYGFDLRAAVSALASDGYFFFKGSDELLRDRRRPLAMPES